MVAMMDFSLRKTRNIICSGVVLVIVFVFVINVLVINEKSDKRKYQKPTFFVNRYAGSPPSQMTQNTTQKDAWQPIDFSNRSFAFSAFIDDAKSDVKIRVIGVKDRNYTHHVFCILWFDKKFGAMETISVRGYIDEHPENFDRSWAAVHFMCRIPSKVYPVAVSLVTDLSQRPLNFIKIRNSADDELHQFGVCLHSPFHFTNDMSQQIVEWIEVNRLLGATHFVFYNYSSNLRSDTVMTYYQRHGVVDVIQWNLPDEADIHYIGQVAAMTDCLYRNFYSMKYVAYLDMDEYIIPRNGIKTWNHLLSNLPNRCGYIARCSVFRVADGYTDTDFPGKSSAMKYSLNTLLVQHRQNYTFGSKDRSKFLLRTACIETAGIHLIQKYQRGWPEMTFSLDDAILHHYRNDYPLFVRRGKSIVDNTMMKYREDLITNVERIWEDIGMG